MLAVARFFRFATTLGLTLSFVAGCSSQDVKMLEAHKLEMLPVRTVAIATIAARPSQSGPLFTGHRGELVGVLAKFETELSLALIDAGYNVIPVGHSSLIYNDPNLEYEIAYLHNVPDFVTKMHSEDELTGFARKLRADANKVIGTREDRRRLFEETDKIDQITSPNTRIFPELGINYRMTLPRHTQHGGASDNRFISDAARSAIGEITRDIGADAFLLIDANLLLSARQEGYMFVGFTGGTRYVTMDGTAALVRNDGAILSVDWFRSQSDLPIGGIVQRPFTTERGSGIAGFHEAPDKYNLLEGSYQAIRVAARDIASRYAQYREEGKKIQAEMMEEAAKRAREEAEKAREEAAKKASEAPPADTTPSDLQVDRQPLPPAQQ